MENLDHWNRFADIDPKFTKAITGKQYKGTSPNPQYVIRCLTEMFGPVGIGFGWRVVSEEFREIGGETLHWCRIEFWHTDRANVVESYGQTKAAYVTGSGKQMVDEDAPKKSLTDAIIKASSWVGIGANIFLGRWDDQKYVAQVDAEYRDAERPTFNAQAAADRIISSVMRQKTVQNLEALYRNERETIEDIKASSADLHARLMGEFKVAKATATDDPAMQAPPMAAE